MTTRRSFFMVTAGALAGLSPLRAKPTLNMTLIHRPWYCANCRNICHNDFYQSRPFCGMCQARGFRKIDDVVDQYGFWGAAKRLCGCKRCLAERPCVPVIIYISKNCDLREES